MCNTILMYVVLFVLTNASNRETNKPILPVLLCLVGGQVLTTQLLQVAAVGCLVASTVSLLV